MRTNVVVLNKKEPNKFTFEKLSIGSYYLDKDGDLYLKTESINLSSDAENGYNCVDPATGSMYYEREDELVFPIANITINIDNHD